MLAHPAGSAAGDARPQGRVNSRRSAQRTAGPTEVALCQKNASYGTGSADSPGHQGSAAEQGARDSYGWGGPQSCPPPMPPGGGWSLDRRVNMGTVLSVITSLAVVISLVVTLATRLEVVEDRLASLEHALGEARSTAVKVERIDERVDSIRRILEEIKDELRDR